MNNSFDNPEKDPSTQSQSMGGELPESNYRSGSKFQAKAYLSQMKKPKKTGALLTGVIVVGAIVVAAGFTVYFLQSEDIILGGSSDEGKYVLI